MEITEVRITLMNEEKLKAYVSVTFDGSFVVRDLKVIQGTNGMFVAMPSKKMKDGSFRDIAHPLNNEFRTKLEHQVLEAYRREAGTKGLTQETTSSSTRDEESLPASEGPSET
ncbi:MAG: septation protein SpoVG [Deltaproteobacteria bacterium RIFCSPLOWO2_02_FULL_50_16]|nr:MAG: septation protein SpoVG [Deltaproteobacteria bacterium GWA2_50_8]OGQ26258.1 MAG: septation protein SpoVG [Deltaproteobacteria bacterium RIFCSPHIGHO2_02_FULL_50_15]OGQ56269.1 MAG: septation protein SpoVG [Deltaproteobacteria bacterium RIFCSPLOWO2_02_FULL_50_16]OGQ65840.1 MAG: septation protein SpoVG [Deltaproteobacteria bacterium RIFCSPLOWO2_12_FULL_50_11]